LILVIAIGFIIYFVILNKDNEDNKENEWLCVDDINFPIRLNNNNIECASIDGKNCLDSKKM